MVVLASPAAAQTASQTFTIPSVTTSAPPKIDGTIDDPAWKNAAHVQLAWDFTFRRPAAEATDAYLLMDQKYLYVAFVAKQTEPIVATQHSNDQPLGADDVVRIYLWPAGDQGFEYGFVTNPVGARFQFSGENAAFSPVWDSAVKTTPDGWSATMRIPLNIMRGDGRKTWRVQFDRRIRNSNQVTEWAHAESQGGTDSSIYAGYLNGMTVSANSVRAKPRLNVYELGQYASAAAGGSTSRVGADLAVPITQTASLVATFHPDYSNVELDQQTISPSAFPRRFQEVRPFFTQGAGFYNNFNCNDCVDIGLYTPAIPTPTTGYAVEGTQGTYSFGAFSSLGVRRTDSAQAVTWRRPDRRAAILFQRQGVDMLGLHDVATFGQFQISNAHNFSVYTTLGQQTGTLVPHPGNGNYAEYGFNLYTPKSGIFGAYHEVGSEFGPVDTFSSFNDVKGPTVYAYREFDFGPKAFVQSLVLSHDFQLYHSHAGALNYFNYSSAISIQTRNKFYVELDLGSNYLNFGGVPGGFDNQDGLYISYGGNTSTPIIFSYYLGRFAAGYLHSITRSASFKVGPRGTLTLQANNTRDALDNGTLLQQWLERVSFGYQIAPGETFAIGVRKIIGTGPPFFGPGRFINGTNLSIALYKRIPHAEIYFAYGDPNQLQTRHDVILKLIQYLGADKGV
ncbi:MAG TPA: DUF5916 domain-containing protein [Candidatus Rubrimentiphilum sp.]|nr:DUF5916 domain-containing protein [Candidatus Rubrimentiphilum sp.]